RLSTGVGGALLDSGTALRGAHLLAGEIGHMISDESPSARTCRCGRRGCLETVASKGAVAEAWQRTAGADADLDHLAAALADRDPRALELLTALAATVGRVLGIAALVTDPDEIVLAGEVGTLLEPVLPALRDAVCRQCLVGADLVVRSGETAHQQGARGAIAALRALGQPLPRLRPARTSDLPNPAEGALSVLSVRCPPCRRGGDRRGHHGHPSQGPHPPRPERDHDLPRPRRVVAAVPAGTADPRPARGRRGRDRPRHLRHPAPGHRRLAA